MSGAPSLRISELLEFAAGGIDVALANLGTVGDALGIAEIRDRWIADCSAGMRQRAAIAIGLAGGHATVILDEPFNWLDPVAAFDLRKAMRARVDGGLTLITALHDLATLVHECDDGAMLCNGGVTLRLSPKNCARPLETCRRSRMT